MLRFEHLSLRRGAKLLFSDASFMLHMGWKVGLTGGNGSGKSSLLSLIQGELHVDAGDFSRPANLEIAFVAQETPTSYQTAIEYVIDGDDKLRSVQTRLAKAEEEGDGVAQAHLHEQLHLLQGYSANARAAQLMHGLGFSAAEENRPVSDFSGGWRMRLNLARALMRPSELLLLDEPTNHLDLDAVIWLEEWLLNYQGALLLISHDRDFLDNVTDHVVHIEHQRALLYTGNYSSFERTRSARLANQQAEYLKQQAEIAHIKSYVERFRAKATKARQAQSRLKALERMEEIAPAHVDTPFHFRFREPEKTPNPLIKLEQVAVGYAGQAVIGGLDFSIAPGDRIGLLGPNGAGKSTLIKLLAGELPSMQGLTRPAQDLQVGYFAQHQVEQLDLDASPLLHLQRLDVSASLQNLRDYLGGFGFIGDQALEPVGPFSGGEKARLALALVVYQRPNLLLLDEPTNHLDLEMRLALGRALQAFTGAMIIVSHDRHLLRITTDQLWLVHSRILEPFAGNLDDYPAWLSQQRRPDQIDIKNAPPKDSAAERKARKRAEAEQRQKLQPFKDRINQLEAALDNCDGEIAEIEEVLASNQIYAPENKEALKELLSKKSAIDQKKASIEEDWLEMSTQLEAAQSGETY